MVNQHPYFLSGSPHAILSSWPIPQTERRSRALQACAPIASTRAPSNPPKALSSFSASAPSPSRSSRNIPASRFTPAQVTNHLPRRSQPSQTPPPEGTGTVIITSDPDGAEIFVDEKFFADDPATLKLSVGAHVIVLKIPAAAIGAALWRYGKETRPRSKLHSIPLRDLGSRE